MEMTDFNIPNYTLIKKIGEGGMATVYLGQHLTLQRKVAIKIINKDLANTPDIRKRFINEARMLSELNHKNIVTLYDFMEMPDNLCLIMEYVEGASLDNFIHKINKGPIPEGSAIEIFKQILEGFAYAHRKGIVHRDIKPSNIILTPDYTPKILDFGIAKIMQSDNRLTRTGTKMGSILYMSPEQVKGQDVDYRSDIYSLGVTLYEMLAGKIPYENYQSDYEIQNDIVLRALPDITLFNPNVSKNIQSIIAKATAKNPEDRFQSCEEFKEYLSQNKQVPEISQATSYAKTSIIQPSFNAGQNPSVKKSNTTKAIIIVSSVAAVLIIAVILIFVVFNNDKSTSKILADSTKTQQNTKPEKTNENLNKPIENTSLSTPDGAARSFVNALGRQDFQQAWELRGGTKWGPYNKFSSVKGYGGISKTFVYDCYVINNEGNTSTVYIDYDSFDPYNRDGRYKQYFKMKKFYDGTWYVSGISNVTITYYR